MEVSLKTYAPLVVFLALVLGQRMAETAVGVAHVRATGAAIAIHHHGGGTTVSLPLVQVGEAPERFAYRASYSVDGAERPATVEIEFTSTHPNPLWAALREVRIAYQGADYIAPATIWHDAGGTDSAIVAIATPDFLKLCHANGVSVAVGASVETLEGASLNPLKTLAGLIEAIPETVVAPTPEPTPSPSSQIRAIYDAASSTYEVSTVPVQFATGFTCAFGYTASHGPPSQVRLRVSGPSSQWNDSGENVLRWGEGSLRLPGDVHTLKFVTWVEATLPTETFLSFATSQGATLELQGRPYLLDSHSFPAMAVLAQGISRLIADKAAAQLIAPPPPSTGDEEVLSLYNAVGDTTTVYTAPRDTLTPGYRFSCTYRFKGKLAQRPLQVSLAFTSRNAALSPKQTTTALLLWRDHNMIVAVEYTDHIEGSGAIYHLLAIDIPTSAFIAIAGESGLAVQIENERIVLGARQMQVLRAIAGEMGK